MPRDPRDIEISRLRAALAEAGRERDGWRETAAEPPKGRNAVLGCWDPSRASILCIRDGRFYEGFSDGPEVRPPTHWMPLPLPPSHSGDATRSRSAHRRLREALEGVLAYEAESARLRGLDGCTCINRSRAAERAYETGRCPHQLGRAALADDGGDDA